MFTTILNSIFFIPVISLLGLFITGFVLGKYFKNWIFWTLVKGGILFKIGLLVSFYFIADSIWVGILGFALFNVGITWGTEKSKQELDLLGDIRPEMDKIFSKLENEKDTSGETFISNENTNNEIKNV